jgi:hypothetical protein
MAFAVMVLGMALTTGLGIYGVTWHGFKTQR